MLGNVLLKVTRHRLACLDIDYFGVIAATFVEISVGGLVHAHYLLRGLESGEVIFHVAEFLLYDSDPFIDEGGGVDSHPVFLVNGVRVVLLYEG